MKILRLVPRMVGSNCYIMISEGVAAVIDPGVPSASIMQAIESNNAKLSSIILTHGHFDHMMGLDHLRTQNPEAEVMIHADDAELMSDGHKNAFFTFFGRDRDFGAPDKLLIKGDEISVGKEKLTVIHTPGHTKGSVCFKLGTVIFSGDTIMSDGYGRCDLYSSDTVKMNISLNRLAELSQKDPRIMIYPGHGEATFLSKAIKNIYNIQ